VADGMGGHAAGEVASGIAIAEIEKFLASNIGKRDLRDVVKQAIDKANREICLQSGENAEYTDMGTTIVMSIIQNDSVLTANVGDSRAYLISGDLITQITKDHSAIQELLDKGLISETEAREHPGKHVITRVLGVNNEVEPDFFDTTLNTGDTLLLCSDGLTDALPDEEIRNAVYSSACVEEACRELVKRAKENDAHDNISVVVARRK